MNKKQLDHYLKGGKFKAIYNPKKLDIRAESKLQIGNKIIVHQNTIVVPLQYFGISNYHNQHAFNCDDIYGWFPEEDINDLVIINEFIDNVEPLPQYIYKMTYNTRHAVVSNFGNDGITLQLPFTVYRNYPRPKDEYVLEQLSNPKADSVEKAVWDGDLSGWIKLR